MYTGTVCTVTVCTYTGQVPLCTCAQVVPYHIYTGTICTQVLFMYRYHIMCTDIICVQVPYVYCLCAATICVHIILKSTIT